MTQPPANSESPAARLKSVQQFIARMPSLSTTVAKVLEICNDPAASPNDLNKVISMDPVLTGQVLKLINSAYYGMPNKITSLTRAIIMLGINTVKNLVLATSVLSSFKGSAGGRGLPVDEFWEHCLGVGVIARIIARKIGIPALEQEEFFVAGLLHDLGKLPMMACFPEIYKQVLTDCDAGCDSDMAERRHLGLDHCHINHLIIAKWRLTAAMGNAIVHHHHPFNENARSSNLLACVSLANRTSHEFGRGDATFLTEDNDVFRQLSETLAVDVEEVMAMKPVIDEQLEKARIFLNVAGKGQDHAG